MTDYLEQLDQVQLALKPLDAHFIARKNKAYKDLYATVLITTLHAGGVLSEEQERVLDLILSSIKLDNDKEYYYSLAVDISAEQIQAFFKLSNNADKKSAFLLDLMILLRLTGPLSNIQQSLLAQLCDAFDLNEDDIQSIDFWVAIILGFPILYLPKKDCEDIWIEADVVCIIGGRKHYTFSRFYEVDNLADFFVRKEEILFSSEVANTLSFGSAFLALDSSPKKSSLTVCANASGFFCAMKVKGDKIIFSEDEVKKKLGTLIKFPDCIKAWEREFVALANPQLEQTLKELISKENK